MGGVPDQLHRMGSARRYAPPGTLPNPRPNREPDVSKPRTTCYRCGKPREPQSGHPSYCLACKSSIDKQYRQNRPPRETCTRCGQSRGDSSHPSYCRPCKQELARESAARRGQWKKPQANCSRCGQERDGRHPAYCRACWNGPMRDERIVQPCSRCGEPKDRPDPDYCSRCRYDLWLGSKYGFTLSQVEEKLAAQGGVCAICGGGPGDRRWHPDHDHGSGQLRGMLCAHCNIGLGHFRDDLALLRRAVAYLEGVSGGRDAAGGAVPG
jgi:hypothetical protein